MRTLSGEALGTPSYMAPNRPKAGSKAVGPAADVYALGAILYQTLTGKPPFLGESAIETLKLVASARGRVSPRRLRPDVPRDLETICLVCLEKAPEKRYRAPPAELALDLKRLPKRRANCRAADPGRFEGSRSGPGDIPGRQPWRRRDLLACLAFIALSCRHNATAQDRKPADGSEGGGSPRGALPGALVRRSRRCSAVLSDDRVAGSPGLIELRRDQGNDASGLL